MNEYLRPWKLATLAAGIALLIAGSFYYGAPDWDVPICFVMGILAYVLAPWTLRVILEHRWNWLPAALLATWFTVDGSYTIYWSIFDPVALEMMRGANWLAALTLYLTCGLVWAYKGSLRDFYADVMFTFAQASR
jgi:hypothetical protein